MRVRSVGVLSAAKHPFQIWTCTCSVQAPVTAPTLLAVRGRNFAPTGDSNLLCILGGVALLPATFVRF